MITYLLSLPIDPIPVATVYEQLPMHCTLFQSFEVPNDTNTLVSHLSNIVRGHGRIELRAGKPDMFGPGNDVPVVRIRADPTLRILHDHILEYLASIRANVLQPQWAGRGYKPHVSNLPNRTFTELEAVTVDKVLLIRKYPMTKYVVASMDLRPDA